MQAQPYTAGGRTISFSNPCDYFTYGKAKASTLSLSVLVAIEMFNAMNALSEVCWLCCIIPGDGSHALFEIEHQPNLPGCVDCCKQA